MYLTNNQAHFYTYKEIIQCPCHSVSLQLQFQVHVGRTELHVLRGAKIVNPNHSITKSKKLWGCQGEGDCIRSPSLAQVKTIISMQYASTSAYTAARIMAAVGP
jgi:hypothetical protein